MNKFSSLLIIFSLISNTAIADCDFSAGIKPNADGSYTYSKDCHIAVGQMRSDFENTKQQVIELKKTIELKDLALKTSDDRVNLWMDTSFKLEQRLNTIDDLRSRNEVLYFGIGVATTVLAVWAAGQLHH